MGEPLFDMVFLGPGRHNLNARAFYKPTLLERARCGSVSRLNGTAADNFCIPVKGRFRGASSARKIKVDKSIPRLKTKSPLKVVDQRPHEVAREIYLV